MKTQSSRHKATTAVTLLSSVWILLNGYEIWVSMDRLGLMQQLGQLPSAPAGASK